jgi:hypothetical protein
MKAWLTVQTLLCVLSTGALCSILAGCAHRPIQPLQKNYLLEDKTGYALLLPSSGSSGDTAFQSAQIPLLTSRPSTTGQSAKQCSISGDVFSLDASDLKGERHWAVRSPSAQGWTAAATRYDIHAEWTHFIQELLRLEQQSCFPSTLPFFTVRRLIAESMPLPASESAYFLYSFGGTGYVDLVPGMELKLERPLKPDGRSPRPSKVISVEAVYRVAATSGRNVALRQISAKGKKDLHGEQSRAMFELATLVHDKPVLRVFLAMGGDKKPLPAIVSGAETATAMQTLTEAILAAGRSCPNPSAAHVMCMVFDGTAVNLLSSVRINGKEQLLPFGTSLGYVVDVKAKGGSLETLSLKRQLATGDYAAVRFPRTLDAVQQIVLLPGDQLDGLATKNTPAHR